jgi:hypothetical protein
MTSTYYPVKKYKFCFEVTVTPGLSDFFIPDFSDNNYTYPFPMGYTSTGKTDYEVETILTGSGCDIHRIYTYMYEFNLVIPERTVVFNYPVPNPASIVFQYARAKGS